MSTHSSSNDLIYKNQFRTYSYRLLNKDRDDNTSLPIKENHKLNILANIRAHQIAKRFSHYSKNDYAMTTVDATKAHLPKGFQGSENIATSGLGKCTELDDNHIYNNHNGKDMAKMSNNAMMYHDQIENNGHRQNILSSNNTLVGIGTAYSKSKHEYFLAEDFGNHNSNSSEDVNDVSYGNTEPTLKTRKVHKWILHFWKKIKSIF